MMASARVCDLLPLTLPFGQARKTMPANYQTVRLAPGRHQRPDDGVCVMELASMLAGERLTDHPRTVCPTLAALLRGYNDGIDAGRRQSLKYYAAASLGTAGGRAAARTRRRMLRAWLDTSAPVSGPVARLGLRLSLLDLQHVGRTLGFRVRDRDDSELHRQVLDLLDALVAAGARPAAPGAAPDRETILT